MFEKLKVLFNKLDFDYSTGPVHPYKFHKYFYNFSKFFRFIDDEPVERKHRYFHNTLILSTLSGIVVTGLALFQAIREKDFVTITEEMTYQILFIHMLITYSSHKFNLNCYHSLYRSMREDFLYVCNEGQRYRTRFFNTEMITWKLCVLCLLMPSSAFLLVACSWILLFYYLINRVPDDPNDTGRPLLIPVWLFDIDVSKSPYYEILFVYLNYMMVMIGSTYSCFTQTQMVFVRRITAKCDLIIYGIQDVMEDIQPTRDPDEIERYNTIIKQRFRIIITQHLSMIRLLEDFAGVYKKVLFFEQKFSGPIMCFIMYAITENLRIAGQLHVVLVILATAIFVVIIIPSFMCTILGEKVRSVCDACFYIEFWNASRVVKPYLVLLMQRSMRPLPLQAPGFEEISLKTFSSSMTGAYSMFNMLRQTDIGNL